MPRKMKLRPPEGAVVSTASYTVPFYDTDGMGIVHHSNYVRYLELGRVRFLAEHDRPYGEYVRQGYHVAVIRVEVQYHWACRFEDELAIDCWLAWVRNASLGFEYAVRLGDRLAVSGRTDHAVVNDEGRPVRIPPELRDRMLALCPR